MNALSLIQAVVDRFQAAVTASHSYRGDATAIVSRGALLQVARTLKEDPVFPLASAKTAGTAGPVYWGGAASTGDAIG